ncbi:hypothetical protein LCGC14_2312340 [marine sediment metagenome]|uniref:Uncharacterized protein n=1 Tax=marine sediment metagenome TaxID=412755 RepID=A0A0F9CKE3_9ZZZZ
MNRYISGWVVLALMFAGTTMGMLFAAVIAESDVLFDMAFVPLLATVACICVVVLKELEVG